MSRPTQMLIGFVLAVGTCACSSAPADPGGERPAERPVVELMPAEQALLEAYEAGGEAWEEARAQALLDPALERFLVDRLVLRMVRSYEDIARPGRERASQDFEHAQAELVRLGEASAPVLAGLLALSDGVVAALAARTLERIGRPAVGAVLSLTSASSAQTRRRAAEVLELLPHAGKDEDAVRLALSELVRADPEWIVRAQAARALGARGARDRSTEPARRVLERALSDPDPDVSEAAAVGLALLGDPLAVPALLRRLALAVEAGDLRGLRACQAALREVTGDRSERDLAGWQDWWYQHRDALQKRPPSR